MSASVSQEEDPAGSKHVSASLSTLVPEDASAWDSAPSSPVLDDRGAVIGWHKASIPYVPGGVSLQTLDVWIPASVSVHEHSARPSSLGPGGRWLIFIHGGAWRDPRVSAASFAPAATRLLSRATTLHLAGLASINYRLSPHPSLPAPDPDDPARQARHPDHIIDVLSGIAFLQRIVGHSSPRSTPASWILAGHSCGATLAFQAVMDPARWRRKPDGRSSDPLASAPVLRQPGTVVGLNGLYDLAGFIADPPASHAELREAYEEFTRGAFGDDEAAWRAACPATAPAWLAEWNPETDSATRAGRRRLAVLVQSHEDTLVPYAQLEEMRQYLLAAVEAGHVDGELEVVEMRADGDHNELWEKGDPLADILTSVLQRM